MKSSPLKMCELLCKVYLSFNIDQNILSKCQMKAGQRESHAYRRANHCSDFK